GAALYKKFRVHKVEVQKGKLVGLRVEAAGQLPVLVRAKTVVNAAGPWGPQLVPRRSAEFRYYQRSYLFLERRITEVALACPVPTRTEPVYFFPRDNISIIGPTEVPFSGNPEDAKVSS